MEFDETPLKPPDIQECAHNQLSEQYLVQKKRSARYGKPIPDLRNTNRKYNTIQEITKDILKLKEDMLVVKDSCKKHDHEIKVLIVKIQELGSVPLRQDRVDRVLDHIKFALIRGIGQHEVDKLFRVDI